MLPLAPVFPSLASYLIGLAFYAAHFPERILSETVRQKLDSIGCGEPFSFCFLLFEAKRLVASRLARDLALLHCARR